MLSTMLSQVIHASTAQGLRPTTRIIRNSTLKTSKGLLRKSLATRLLRRNTHWQQIVRLAPKHTKNGFAPLAFHDVPISAQQGHISKRATCSSLFPMVHHCKVLIQRCMIRESKQQGRIILEIPISMLRLHLDHTRRFFLVTTCVIMLFGTVLPN